MIGFSGETMPRYYKRCHSGLVYIFILFALPCIFSSPSKGETGFVVFEKYYINYAAGYRLCGEYIDRSGNIWKYDRRDEVWRPDEITQEIFTEDALIDKFRNAELIGHVESSLLAEMVSLIGGASGGKIVGEETGSDMGTLGYVAYTVDETTGGYRIVLLDSYGDRSESNISAEAKRLLELISKIWPELRRAESASGRIDGEKMPKVQTVPSLPLPSVQQEAGAETASGIKPVFTISAPQTRPELVEKSSEPSTGLKVIRRLPASSKADTEEE